MVFFWQQNLQVGAFSETAEMIPWSPSPSPRPPSPDPPSVCQCVRFHQPPTLTHILSPHRHPFKFHILPLSLFKQLGKICIHRDLTFVQIPSSEKVMSLVVGTWDRLYHDFIHPPALLPDPSWGCCPRQRNPWEVWSVSFPPHWLID